MNLFRYPRAAHTGFLSIILVMLDTHNAFAKDAAPVAGSGLMSLLPLLLIMVIFYFLLIRPQQKKLKEHRAVIEGLKVGDKVITSGGVFGTIKTVNEHDIRVEIAQGVRVKVKRDSIANLSD